jgi:hypothetical protein
MNGSRRRLINPRRLAPFTEGTGVEAFDGGVHRLEPRMVVSTSRRSEPPSSTSG